MTISQPGILLPIPFHSRYLELNALAGCHRQSLLEVVAQLDMGDNLVIGFGPKLLGGHDLAGYHPFQAQSDAGYSVAATQADLWCWVRGESRGEVARAARKLTANLCTCFEVVLNVNGFKVEHVEDGKTFPIGRDLSGYEDGTENPVGDDAIEAAFSSNAGAGLDGGSFVSVQKWLHDLNAFDAKSLETRDHILGRRISDNEELDDAPASAHVKRTAQETFTPEAFMLRRSMPWSDANGEGLMFVSFGHSLAAFDAQLNRMTGHEDGILDGLFQFSQPITGSNFWCPPVMDGRLNLSALKE